MDALLLREPAVVDLLVAANRSGQRLVSRRALTESDRSDLSSRSAILASQVEALRTDLEKAFRETPDFNKSTQLEPALSPLLTQALAPTILVNDLERGVARARAYDRATPPRIVAATTQALGAHARLWPELLAQEADMLHAREHRDLGRRWTALLTVLAALLLTAGLMVWLARRIVKDLDGLGAAARGLATGDLTVRADVNSEDEIGRLAIDFNEMAVRLEELSSQVREGAAGINAAAADILSSVSQQTAGAAQQSTAISEISAAAQEIRVTSELMLEKAQHMARQGQASLAISREGTDAMKAIQQGMASIREKVEETGADILALAEQTQQIGEITALVSDLADQSNILSLNANIEAAKAGEQGKGFAVVAAQVRLLAEQSKQATGEVTRILAEIRNAANAAVVATEAGNTVVEEGMALAVRAGQVIDQLADTIGETADSAEQIARGAREQKTGIEQITQAIQNVNQATSQFVTGARESQGTAEGLSELAGPLRELTERYKVTAGNGGHADVARQGPVDGSRR
jgi:methyl-accepting chemotaxis protein